MPKNERRRTRRLLALLLTASLTAVFTPAATSNPKQEESERVLKEGRGRNNVTEITKLKLKGAHVLFAKKFVGDDDWLTGLSVSVKNISRKPITYVELEIRLFGDGDKEPTGRPLYIYPLSYGRPAAGEVAESAPDAPQLVAPGSTVEIVLTEEEYLSLKNHLAAAGYPLKMKQAELLVTDVFFADGTRWYKGMRLRRSPDDPARWVADKDAPHQARGAPRPGPTREPNRSRGPLALRAEAAFIFAGFTPAPILSADRALPPAAGPPTQEPCREAKPPIDEVPCGAEVPGCTAKDDRVEGTASEAPARLVSGERACTRPSGQPGGACNKSISVSVLEFCATPTPTPTPPTPQSVCENNGGVWDFAQSDCQYPGGICNSDGCPPPGFPGDIYYCACSPVLIDVAGDGFRLTAPAAGVLFDLNGDARRGRISWTAPGTDDAWLALDRNGNGLVDDGRELFGDFSPQPEPPAGAERNGFLALAEFDRPEAGGDGDGSVTPRDAVFASLRLWRDANHNGVSEPGELRPPPELNVVRFGLDYKESKRADEYGNRFKYRAAVRDAKGARVGRWAWDVYLVRAL